MSIGPAYAADNNNGSFTSTTETKGSAYQGPEAEKRRVTIGYLHLVTNKPEALGALLGREPEGEDGGRGGVEGRSGQGMHHPSWG